MTHLYIIRHGQAISSVERTMGDRGLSPLGIRQAERLRDRLAATGEIAADVLIASTMRRAKETAEIIAPALDIPIIFDDDIQEWRDNEPEGVSEKEYSERFNAVEFAQKPFHQMAPYAETWAQFMLRTCTALNRITNEYAGKTIVIVCHGGIVDGSFLFFFGLSSLQFPRAFFSTHNTSITHWFKEPDEWYERLHLPVSWILERYNDVMHLRDINSPVSIPWKDLAAKPVVGDEKSVAPTEMQ